jgi:hypothetical protein
MRGSGNRQRICRKKDHDVKMYLLVASLATLNTPAMAADALQCDFSPGGVNSVEMHAFEIIIDLSSASADVVKTSIALDGLVVPYYDATMEATSMAYRFAFKKKFAGEPWSFPALVVNRLTSEAVFNQSNRNSDKSLDAVNFKGTCRTVHVTPKL